MPPRLRDFGHRARRAQRGTHPGIGRHQNARIDARGAQRCRQRCGDLAQAPGIHPRRKLCDGKQHPR